MMGGRHSAPARRWWVAGLGAALVVAGGALAYRVEEFLHHSSSSARALVRDFEASQPATQAAGTGTGGLSPAAASCTSTAPGGARMLLEIPALHEIAPVLEGTSDATLGVGVGHLASSPWPAAGGNTVLDAHDVTFFRSIDALRRGDQVLLVGTCTTWRYEVSGSTVLEQGRPVAAATGPHLVLVTCWPTDALFYTTKRFVVVARLATVAPTRAVLPAARRLPDVTAALAPALAALHLDASTAGVPLGTLSLDGRFDASWLTSSRPLQASDAATRLLEAAVVAARGREPGPWRVMAPGVPFSAVEPLAGPLIWLAPVHVAIFGRGVQVTRASLGATVEIRGSPRDLAVTTAVRRGVMVITRFELLAP